MLREFGGSLEQTSKYSSVLGIIAFLNVPLIFISVKFFVCMILYESMIYALYGSGIGSIPDPDPMPDPEPMPYPEPPMPDPEPPMPYPYPMPEPEYS